MSEPTIVSYNVVDMHVHARDGEQSDAETIAHLLDVANRVGVVAVGDMPNTPQPIFTQEGIEERLNLVRKANIPEVQYGIHIGITADSEQIKNAAQIVRENEQVVGIKFFAGHSVGELGIIDEDKQYKVYKTLAEEKYDGVLVLHCEKESYIKNELWTPEDPISHAYARPEQAEVESVKDQLYFAKQAGFKGKLHITHTSSPSTVEMVRKAKEEGEDVSIGVCPHHLIYDTDDLRERGVLLKMNPALRSPESRKQLMYHLKEGHIDTIETDHAPHTLKQKMGVPYASGIPGLAHWPLYIKWLEEQGISEQHIKSLTALNTVNRYNLGAILARRGIEPGKAVEVQVSAVLQAIDEYAIDPHPKLTETLKQYLQN